MGEAERRESLAKITGDAERRESLAQVTGEEAERRLEPLSDEWFDDLDKSIDEISRLFEELRVAPPEPEDLDDIQHAEDSLAAIEQDLSSCFTRLETFKRRFRDSRCRSWSTRRSSNEDDIYKLFRPRSLDSMPCYH